MNVFHAYRPKRVLNVGSGPANPAKLHPAFQGSGWREVRLDVEPQVRPDIVGDMVDMRGTVADASFDAVWSSHNVEHLSAHQVPLAFGEFRRILKPDGFVLVTCPDVEAIAGFIVENGIDAVAYHSAAGPVTPVDMLWGHGASIAAGFGFMAHHTGFTVRRLADAGLAAGFAEVRVARSAFDLWAVCLMPDCRIEVLRDLFAATAQRSLFEEEDEDLLPVLA